MRSRDRDVETEASSLDVKEGMILDW